MRVTIRALEIAVAEINRICDTPAAPYTKHRDGTFTANIGNYHLGAAHGGWCLQQIHNDGGDITFPLGEGFIPKRELLGKLRAFIAGHDAALRGETIAVPMFWYNGIRHRRRR